jgi:hypothetical protein
VTPSRGISPPDERWALQSLWQHVEATGKQSLSPEGEQTSHYMMTNSNAIVIKPVDQELDKFASHQIPAPSQRNLDAIVIPTQNITIEQWGTEGNATMLLGQMEEQPQVLDPSDLLNQRYVIDGGDPVVTEPGADRGDPVVTEPGSDQAAGHAPTQTRPAPLN